ncbi:MAG: FAD-dependent oxidoreductase, partial [Pseudomonadota bacterium]
PDVALRNGYLLDHFGGTFVVLSIDADVEDLTDLGLAGKHVAVSTRDDPSGALGERYLGTAQQAIYLIRPDQHVAARWPVYDADRLAAAIAKATGLAT